MRFLNLHLLAFGAFTDHLLEFGAKQGRLHLVYGANESGKSTTLRAIGDLLFGFHSRTTDAFLHGDPALRVGAEITNDRGEALRFYRRKGRSKTLLDPQGQPLEDNALGPYLGVAERDFFERMAGLDHVRLRRGGEELLRGGGDVAVGLFEAGAGLVGLRDVVSALDEDADRLYRPRGKKMPLINVALKTLAEARKRSKQATLSGEAFHKVEVELANVERVLKETAQRISQLERDLKKRERIRTNLVPLAVHAHLLERQRELAEVPDLPEDATKQRLDAQQRRRAALDKLQHAEQRISDVETKRNELVVSDSLLARGEAIDKIVDMRAVVQGAEKDLRKREISEESCRANLERLLREVALDVAASEAEDHLPARPNVRAINALAKEHERLHAERLALSEARNKLQVEFESKERELEGIPLRPDPAPLEREVKQVHGLGPIEKQLREARSDLALKQKKLDQSVKSLPGWDGALADLAALAVPGDATVQRFAKAWEKNQSELDKARESLKEAKREINRCDEKRAAIAAEGDVPTEEAVRDARQQREAGWRLIRRAYIDDREDVAAEATQFDPSHELPEAYESAVARADGMADKLRAEAKRVAQYNLAVADLHRLQEVVGEREKACLTAEQQQASLEHEWAALWEPLGIRPLPPTEMRGWLHDRAALVEQADAVERQRATVAEVEENVRASRASLSRSVTDVGESAATDEENLAALVERAGEVADACRNARNERARLEKTIDDLSSKLADARQSLEAKQQALKGWHADWARAVEAVKRDADAQPAEVQALLEVYEDIRVEARTWKELRHRVETMRADKRAFEEALAALLPEVAPELVELPPVDAAAQLASMLQQAREARERRTTLDEQLDRLRSDVENANMQLEQADADLAVLCRQAKCTDPTQLEAIEDKVRERRETQERITSVEDQLISGGAGHTLDELVQEARGVDGEELATEIAQLEAELRDLVEEKERLIDQRSGLRHDQEAMTGADDAARAAQAAEMEVARIRDAAGQWLHLRVASSLLRRGIERYRERNQGPLLVRASELFARLTRGSFQNLTVDLGEDDQPVLLGVRANGKGLRVEGMSDGTRDQLFLALRLAVIEQYLAGNESLPFVGDDVLVHFDDDRSEATLTVLTQLAEKTQVLYFTHHTHMVELARKVLPPERLAIHELPPS